MLVAHKAKLRDILNTLTTEYQVAVPVQQAGTSAFEFYRDNTEVMLNGNTRISPKGMFFPQTEKMYGFKTVKNTTEIVPLPVEQGKRLLFGVRSCDLKSLDCLDQVFLTKGYIDDFYKHKRERTVIIALGCNEPGETCFCASLGLDPQKAVGADVQAYDLGEVIGFEAVTEAGQKVLGLLKNHLSEQQVTLPPVGEFYLKPEVAGVPEKLQGMFESPLWEEIARKCLNCGACTYVCPTCHCFDISQDVRGENGTKYRCWDSCMFGEYTQMAGGHNPRPTKKERVRNRFMHKLNYFPERYNMLLCTGCGRCLDVCPVKMDITSIIQQIKEAE
jgi:sulfhydrogenase subunit beta (sulfur reductase)